jgi:hypothetical protein
MTLGRRTNWEQFFTPPTAPSNYVDPKKINAYIEERMKEREEQAHYMPVAGTVHTCVVLDVRGDLLVEESSGFNTKEGEVAYKSLTAIASLLNFNFAPHEDPYQCGAVLFGLNIRDRLRIMALDALQYIARENVQAQISPHLWFSPAFTAGITCDPYETVIPSDRRKDIPYNGLCKFLGIDLGATIDLDIHPRLQADVARKIALTTQLTTF